MLFPKRQKVTSRNEFESHIFDLMDHNDAVQWSNDTVYSYLQHMAAWLHDAEEFYRERGEDLNPDTPSWQLFADMLEAAAGECHP